MLTNPPPNSRRPLPYRSGIASHVLPYPSPAFVLCVMRLYLQKSMPSAKYRWN